MRSADGVVQAQHLVQTGANIAAHDKKRVTTLHFAAAHGHLDVVSFLWSKGAELDWETPGEAVDYLAVSVITSLQTRRRCFCSPASPPNC